MEFRLLCCLLVAIALDGCALRPAASVLTPVATDASDTRHVELFSATSRNLTGETSEFGTASDRSLALNYERYQMSIPPSHKVGAIEWPTGVADPERHVLRLGANLFNGRSICQGRRWSKPRWRSGNFHPWLQHTLPGGDFSLHPACSRHRFRGRCDSILLAIRRQNPWVWS